MKNYFQSKHGVYTIAEIGGNHEGNFNYAQKIAELAIQTGVDAVKFQIYTGDSIANPVVDPDRNQHFKKFELKPEQYISLAKYCHNHNVSFMASVWDPDAFSYIDPYIPIYKIGSGDLTAYNLIKHTLNTKKPIILSTGLSTIDEVKQTISFIKKLDSSYITEKKLALLQCTAMYPIPENDANLNVMSTYKQKFDLPIGYSNHVVGSEALITAVCMGAEILEFHFTDNRENKKFRDHKLSLTKDEVISLINKIKMIKKLQGSFQKTPTTSEIENNHIVTFRRAVYINKNLKAGTIITEDDLVTLRPNIGIDAKYYYTLIGKKIKKDVKKYQKLTLQMFS